jgi:hypothetical protein
MADKHAQLVDRLLARTERGLMDWRQGVHEGEFVVDLPTTSIGIREIALRNAATPPTVVLTLFDSSGRPVDSFSDGDLQHAQPREAYGSKARALYRLAQRTSLEAERVLDEALGDLEDGVGA